MCSQLMFKDEIFARRQAEKQTEMHIKWVGTCIIVQKNMRHTDLKIDTQIGRYKGKQVDMNTHKHKERKAYTGMDIAKLVWGVHMLEKG